MRRLHFILLTLFVSCLSLSAPADGPAQRVSHVWIREAPPGVTVLAGYFTLENLTDQALTLTGASSPDFDSVELHKSFQKGGVESMEPVDKIGLAPHQSVVFEPGSYHLMLMQPHKQLHTGDTLTLFLDFSDGSRLTILAPLRRDPPKG
jgi:copper(I)-binding protein